MTEKKDLIEVIDLNDKKIKLNSLLPLYYTEGNKNYSIRVDFKETFNNSLEYYLLTGFEPVNINEFDLKELKNDNYEGKFINKVVLKDGSILNSIYSFIGFENKELLKLVPVKIPKKNKYTVDPLSIQSINWYYLTSNNKDDDFITLKKVLDDIEIKETKENKENKETKKEKKTKKNKKTEK